MAMSGGQQRYARTPATVHGQQHTLHGASACGSLITARNILHRVILAEHVSRACCGIMCAEVHKGFYGLHYAVTENTGMAQIVLTRLKSMTVAMSIIDF